MWREIPTWPSLAQPPAPSRREAPSRPAIGDVLGHVQEIARPSGIVSLMTEKLPSARTRPSPDGWKRCSYSSLSPCLRRVAPLCTPKRDRQGGDLVPLLHATQVFISSAVEHLLRARLVRYCALGKLYYPSPGRSVFKDRTEEQLKFSCSASWALFLLRDVFD